MHSERLLTARAAQAQWAAWSVPRRARVLGSLRSLIARRCEEIAAIVAADAGKPILDALAGDVMVTLEHLRFCETRAARILRPRRVPKPAFFWHGARFRRICEPHGVALIYAPSNYPMQLSLVPACTALITGNAVLLKCSEQTPHTASLIAALCAQAGFPSGLLQVFTDDAANASAWIDAGPDFVFFTGSTAHGRSIAAQAARRLIPAILELGGKDPSLVFADCRLDRAIEGVAYGAFSNAGRVCVGIRRLYIEQPLFETFTARLALRIAQLRAGHDFCPLEGDARLRLEDQLHDALARGAQLVFPTRSSLSAALPVLLTHVPPDARLLTEETFGPVLCAAPFQDEAEAVRLANGSPFALGASVWTARRARGLRVAAQIDAGACAINDVIRNIANPSAPFGGNRHSGYGRYRGAQGLFAFSRLKSVMWTPGRRSSELHWFPFTPRTTGRLAMLLRLRHASSGPVARIGRWLLPILLLVLLPARGASAQPPREHLEIAVSLSPRSHGSIGYLVFASADGFPGDVAKAVRHGFVPVPPGAARVAIDAGLLPPGRYAVSVYQDVNGNRKLDHAFLGIPREPVGVSGNPRPRWGPPSFDPSSFALDANTTISIRMVYRS